jgi:uncharacterized protein
MVGPTGGEKPAVAPSPKVRDGRLNQLPCHTLQDRLRVVETGSFGSRLLGLALLGDLESDTALLIRRCRSVHTLGMMFDIDAVFLDRSGTALKTVTRLRPGRLAGCRAAHAVLETPAGRAERFLAAGAGALAIDQAPDRRPGRLTPRLRLTLTRRPRAAGAETSMRKAQAPRSR